MHREKNNVPFSEYKEDRRSYRTAGDRKETEHGRKWVFWVVDAALIAVILAAVLFIVSLLTPFSLFGGGEEQRSIQYSVEIAGVDSSSVEALHVGDRVINAETGREIGTVSYVEIRPYEVYTDKPSAEKDAELDSFVVTKVTYPEGYNTITVVISVDAEYVQGEGYTASGSRIAVGRSYSLRFPFYAGNGVCISLAE